jgi:hypothetical protein
MSSVTDKKARLLCSSARPAHIEISQIRVDNWRRPDGAAQGAAARQGFEIRLRRAAMPPRPTNG